ncbi:MAG TPA: hypothetical protein VE177_03140, partial [Candidatus Binatus sp.]|nr:hypothetical protein [Candidatus Binatus sp.]
MSEDVYPLTRMTRSRFLLLQSLAILTVLGFAVVFNSASVSPSRFFARHGPVESSPSPDFQLQIQPGEFLMQNRTTSHPSLVFTPVNGFTGSITVT